MAGTWKVTLLSLLVILFTLFISGDAYEWKIHRDRRLLRNPANTIFVTDYKECQQSCLAITTFLCSAVEYFGATGECRIRIDSSFNTLLDTEPRLGWNIYEIKEVSVWQTLHGACLIGENDLVLQDIPMAEFCQEACETEVTFRCKSFTYDTANNRCILTRYDQDTRYLNIPCYGSDYHERMTVPGVKVHYGQQGISSTSKVVTNLSPRECIDACMTETSLECHGSNYNSNDRTCQLLSVITAQNTSAVITLYTLRERIRWRYYREVCIPGAEYDTLRGLTVSGCMEACETAEATTCRSVNYNTTSGDCQLLMHWSLTTGLSIPCIYPNMDYYEMFTDPVECLRR